MGYFQGGTVTNEDSRNLRASTTHVYICNLAAWIKCDISTFVDNRKPSGMWTVRRECRQAKCAIYSAIQ